MTIKNRIAGIAFVLLCALTATSVGAAPAPAKKQKTIRPSVTKKLLVTKKRMAFSISSPAFKHQGFLPSRYTCDGDGISPPLRFQGVPEKAQNLVLMMEDPDVPKVIRMDGVWEQWVVWNIPPATQSIAENRIPPGVIGKNTDGGSAYYPACPPDREHRYFFKAYSLDVLLELPTDSDKKRVIKAMKGHILARAELVGCYKRK